MENVIKKLNFKGTWRIYQKRVLTELKQYLDDRKLNVVAAPGAGKTTLGIEVIKMLGHNVLILAPTITIRNQWKERICADFLIDKNDFNEISLDAKNIKPVTIVTYQLIHSIMSDKKQSEEFINSLNNNDIKVVVLDEAHHLRTEWYNSLIKLCDTLNVVTVSLTGTPPYDVPASEWKNYNTLCGNVDAEISIPELVKSNDLAPHQDLLWFSKLELDEEKVIKELKENIRTFSKYLKENSEFLYAIKASPFLNNLDKNIDLIYENTDFTISIISYLLDNDDLDTDALTLLSFLAIEKEQVPPFTLDMAKILTDGMLGAYEVYFKNIPAIRETLKELGLLESAKRVDLTGNVTTTKIFSKSKSKLKSIQDITDIEYNSLKNDLREVVLVDFIGQNNRAGVNILSVFDMLKNNNYKLGILSGTLIVIPKSAKDALYNLIEKNGIKKENVLTSEFEKNYLRVEAYGNVNLVLIITKLFYDGEINVIVGTQALLGEGWDSPCVNSLILGSIVGSFMLSNQMRGRAIRIDKNNPEKISDIWHLACLSEYLDSPDMEIITRRFKTFEGISFVDNTIQNGIERLGLNDIRCTNCTNLNNIAAQKATAKEDAKAKWSQAFKSSVITEKNFVSKVYEIVKAPKLQVPAIMVNHNENFFVKFFIIPFFLRRKSREFKRKYAPLVASLLTIMHDADILTTPLNKIKIDMLISHDYTPFVTISNCSDYERKLFVDTLTEFLSPAKEQRYVLKRENKYVAVPDIIGVKKEYVKKLAKLLSVHLGYLDVIYTRSPLGRKELLKAKYNHLFDNNIKTSRIWL